MGDKTEHHMGEESLHHDHDNLSHDIFVIDSILRRNETSVSDVSNLGKASKPIDDGEMSF